MTLGAPVAQPPPVDQEVRIGVLAYRDHWVTMGRWQPTADYLSRTVPGYRFSIATYDHTGLRQALAAGSLDFVLTNTGHYLELNQAYGVLPIATLVNRYGNRPLTRFGAAVFARADRDDIRAADDLRGLRFAATGAEAFGGFQVTWHEFRRRDLDPFKDFEVLQLTGLPQDQVVLAVRDGLADAGTVRTGVLERMAQEGTIELSTFKILDPRPGDGFPYLHSTALYPEWPLARAADTPAQLAKAVAEALFELDPDSEPAVRAQVSGWTVPMDYSAAEQVLRTLHVAPFAAEGENWAVRFGPLAFWFAALLTVPVLLLTWRVLRVRQSPDRRDDALP